MILIIQKQNQKLYEENSSNLEDYKNWDHNTLNTCDMEEK